MMSQNYFKNYSENKAKWLMKLGSSSHLKGLYNHKTALYDYMACLATQTAALCSMINSISLLSRSAVHSRQQTL